METRLEQIAVKAVNQLPKSVVREIRTPRSVGAGGGRPPPATRWASSDRRLYSTLLSMESGGFGPPPGGLPNPLEWETIKFLVVACRISDSGGGSPARPRSTATES